MAGQSKKQAAADRRARIAEMQAAERARDRRNKILLGAGAVVIAAGAIIGIAAAVDNNGSKASTASASSVSWAAPTDTDAAVKAAGLTMLNAEGTAEHIHIHLDVWANGQKVTVPQLVGINEGAGTISPLHTHDTTGVVHIESPVVKDYHLGQFMTEWGVPISSTQLGPDKTDATHTLKVYVNGKETTGDPSQLVFHAHDEIAIVYGTAAQNASVQIPSSYTWPSGL
ncbi:hypothetical protein [Streptacidiphilus jiangxiensis]|uniref:Uncharacterized protein n=1 Tax=Streptacidiphilus jiangxiensis TaxID=235985 RepID=A0A1H7VUF2_STRJI|nr:hypothetical protein [Streptacidiphilus jiangxiensis]SEM12883.1 hypothetical protein SAMN05414137_1193 [Streptacidiphilus jiangxiensis]